MNRAQVREGTAEATNLLIRPRHKQLWTEEAGVEFFLTWEDKPREHLRRSGREHSCSLWLVFFVSLGWYSGRSSIPTLPVLGVLPLTRTQDRVELYLSELSYNQNIMQKIQVLHRCKLILLICQIQAQSLFPLWRCPLLYACWVGQCLAFHSLQNTIFKLLGARTAQLPHFWTIAPNSLPHTWWYLIEDK